MEKKPEKIQKKIKTIQKCLVRDSGSSQTFFKLEVFQDGREYSSAGENVISLLGSKKDVYIYMYSNKSLSVGKVFCTCLSQKIIWKKYFHYSILNQI